MNICIHTRCINSNKSTNNADDDGDVCNDVRSAKFVDSMAGSQDLQRPVVFHTKQSYTDRFVDAYGLCSFGLFCYCRRPTDN